MTVGKQNSIINFENKYLNLLNLKEITPLELTMSRQNLKCRKIADTLVCIKFSSVIFIFLINKLFQI